MWRKQEREPKERTTPVVSKTRTEPAPAPAREVSRVAAGSVLVGELGGDSDAVIAGRVEGSVTLERAAVEVESTGVVIANVAARSIRVAGEIRGDLRASQDVVLLETARVEGNIYTKSLRLDDGAQLNGSVDMEIVASASKPASNGVVAASHLDRPAGAPALNVS